MYLTRDQLKTRLWITWNGQDSLLDIFLGDSWSMLVSRGLDYERKPRTKIVQGWMLYEKLYLDCPEVQSINEINGVAYTWVKDTDFLVFQPYNAVVLFNDIPASVSIWVHGYVSIKYTAGYAPIPDDLVRLQFLLCQSYYLNYQMNSGVVTKVKLWPREMTYWDPLTRTKSIQNDIDDLIYQYQMHYV